MLPLHIVTVAHQAMPFIRRHIDVFTQLQRPWTWRICEGVCPCPWAGRILPDMHKNGLSTDGTSEYLEALALLYHPTVKVYQSDKYLTEKIQMMTSDITDE